MNDTPSSPWRALRTSLSYRIAIFTFWYWRFEALACEKHFTALKTDQALSTLPAASAHNFLFPSHPVSEKPAVLRTQGDLLIYTPKTFPNYFVNLRLDGGFQQYLQNFSSKTRSTLNRKVRRFAEASPHDKLDWRVYQTPEEMAGFLDLASELSESTYQARLLNCGLPTSAKFRKKTNELAGQGLAYGFMLFLAERPAAYVYCERRGGIVTYDYVGHDPALNALSPGTVLQYQLLEYLFADPDASIFDFTEGEGNHKALFATDKKLCAKSLAFPRRMGTAMLIRSHIGLNQLNDFIDNLADRIGLRQKIRRLMRHG